MQLKKSLRWKLSLISIPNTFTVGAVIVASQHNSNFSIIYSDYNGNVDNTNISASAAIADTKLAQITTAGKLSGAAFTVLGSIPSGAGTIPAKNGGTGGDLSAALIGAVPYFSATGVMSALAAGTTGQVKVSQGGAAPIWANALSSVLDYGTSTGTSTARQATAIKVAYGTTSSLAGPGGTFVVTNLSFTSSSSYIVQTTQVDTGTVGSGNVTYTSGASFTITNSAVPSGSNVSHTFSWFAIGV